MYAAVAVVNDVGLGDSVSSAQLISGSGSALSDSQFVGVPDSSISTGSSRIELDAESAQHSLQSTTHGLLDGTTTSAVIKRMPIWGWIVIVFSVVCVLAGILLVVSWLVKESSTNTITQMQTTSIVVSEAFPYADKAYNDDSGM